MTLALILLVLFALIILFIVVTLLIPAAISVRLVKDGPVAEVRVYFGLLLGALAGRIEYGADLNEFQARILGFTLFRRPRERRAVGKGEEKTRKKTKKKGADWKTVLANADELYSAGKALVRELTRHLSLKRARGKLAVGLPDAAETGMLIGALYAGRGIANAAFPQADLEIEPSFHEEKLDTDVALEFSLPLVTILAPVIRFLWKTRKIFRIT
ncbi:MAG: DUF2953 domain-containing protein [Methanomicrobia archaeon]|nr:DUF2953 domain-containing protein [Methanomicrobia archaeon]